MSVRRFAAVPTSRLRLDEPLAPSAHATETELHSFVRHVPEVYALLRAGASDAELESMRHDPSDPHAREVGDTYHHLFSPRSGDGGIRADYDPVRGLTVEQGRHRFAAARALGIDHLPVEVRGHDPRALDAHVDRGEQLVELDHPGTVAVQRELDHAHREARGEAPRGPDSSRGRSRERT